MKNIFVLNNRLDASNGTVENVPEMKTKKTFWLLRFAQTAVLAGIALLAAPLEQAEANHGNSATPATVSYVDLVGFFDLTRQPNAVVEFPNSEFGSWWCAKIDVTSDGSTTGLYQGGYLIIFHYPYYPTPDGANESLFEKGDGWVKVWIWMGGGRDDLPVDYVYDSTNSDEPGSAGTSYSVDLYVDGYLVSGPSF